MRTRRFALLLVALAAGFSLGLWKLYQMRFQAGDIYPAYSSLRADPLGTKALFDSLGELPGLSVSRNYQAFSTLPQQTGVVFLLGEDPFLFEMSSENKLKELEALASGGARIVIAMRPVRRVEAPKTDPAKDKQDKQGKKDQDVHPHFPLEKRWNVTFGYLTRSAKETDEGSGITRLTALYFVSEGTKSRIVERPFGKGLVVLLVNSYEFSNEALAGDRDTGWIARAIGGRSSIVFDESHLGIAESGGVATLARKYHLEGVVAGLLLLLALFIWKNSVSFLPPRPEPGGAQEGLEARDASSGLANLMRRNIPVKNLMKVCLERWQASQFGGMSPAREKVDRVRSLLEQPGDPAEMYREAQKILANRSRG